VMGQQRRIQEAHAGRGGRRARGRTRGGSSPGRRRRKDARR
jgi:hypothetical protein